MHSITRVFILNLLKTKLTMANKKIIELLGDQADSLLNHECKTISKKDIFLPNPDHVDEVWRSSNRSNQTLKSLQNFISHGRLGGTGYLSILPVDQGIEHSAGASFAPVFNNK